MGRNTNVLQNRRQNRQAKAGWQAWSKRTRSLGHGLSLPWYAPRRGPGGQHDPTVTNQRPSGTVKPHASSRGTGSIPRAGRQPHAWRWGGMAPEAKVSGKARGRCSKGVDLVLDCYPKLVAIDEEPDHEIVHGRRFGKANGATHEPL